MRYPISASLKTSLHNLYDNPSAALETLGAERSLSEEWYEKEPLKVDISTRVKQLRCRLENYIEQMANESIELQSIDETVRLRSECLGVLISLRELATFIPECLE